MATIQLVSPTPLDRDSLLYVDAYKFKKFDIFNIASGTCGLVGTVYSIIDIASTHFSSKASGWVFLGLSTGVTCFSVAQVLLCRWNERQKWKELDIIFQKLEQAKGDLQRCLQDFSINSTDDEDSKLNERESCIVRVESNVIIQDLNDISHNIHRLISKYSAEQETLVRLCNMIKIELDPILVDVGSIANSTSNPEIENILKKLQDLHDFIAGASPVASQRTSINGSLPSTPAIHRRVLFSLATSPSPSSDFGTP